MSVPSNVYIAIDMPKLIDDAVQLDSGIWSKHLCNRTLEIWSKCKAAKSQEPQIAED